MNVTIKVWTKVSPANAIGEAYNGMFGFEMTSWGSDWFELTNNSEEANQDAYEVESELDADDRIQSYETYK